MHFYPVVEIKFFMSKVSINASVSLELQNAFCSSLMYATWDLPFWRDFNNIKGFHPFIWIWPRNSPDFKNRTPTSCLLNAGRLGLSVFTKLISINGYNKWDSIWNVFANKLETLSHLCGARPLHTNPGLMTRKYVCAIQSTDYKTLQLQENLWVEKKGEGHFPFNVTHTRWH